MPGFRGDEICIPEAVLLSTKQPCCELFTLIMSPEITAAPLIPLGEAAGAIFTAEPHCGDDVLAAAAAVAAGSFALGLIWSIREKTLQLGPNFTSS